MEYLHWFQRQQRILDDLRIERERLLRLAEKHRKDAAKNEDMMDRYPDQIQRLAAAKEMHERSRQDYLHEVSIITPVIELYEKTYGSEEDRT